MKTFRTGVAALQRKSSPARPPRRRKKKERTAEGCAQAPRRGAAGKARKKPAAPYSRTSERRTTLGEGALDFRVRNGNGYFSPSMATGEKP